MQFKGIFTLLLFLELCPSAFSDPLKNYSYAGPFIGEESKFRAEDYARDINAAFEFRKKYPLGFVTVFGGSRLGTNTETYKGIYEFAKQWTDLYGKSIPILSGAGPGAMEAANRGASDSTNHVSIGFTTYFGTTNADEAFWKYQDHNIVTDGLIFSSISVRETMMMVNSSAIVFTPGGSGTEWELFQVLEMIKSKQLKGVPVYLVGSRAEWQSFWNRIDALSETGMLGRNPDGSLLRLDKYFTQVDDLKGQIPVIAGKLIPSK